MDVPRSLSRVERILVLVGLVPARVLCNDPSHLVITVTVEVFV
ncbi:hypothetical protein [Acetobacter sp. UBA5411]|nr:hypothetical protein [Acetobacter sp. UBA5411]